MKKTTLLTPGPTPVPERVLARLGSPLVHHRTIEFERIFEEVRAGLKMLYETQQEVLVLACTGTGAMEAAVANLFCHGDSVITINTGKFGERWTQIAQNYGLKTYEWRINRGESIPLDQLQKFVESHSDAKAILFQASETSTGLKLPTEQIAALAKKNRILSICDAITACGVFELPMDRWNIDVLITGGQKALMIPPGLACIALSELAWSAAEKSDLPKFYFDLKRERKAHLKNQTAWTPATGLIMGLHESLKIIFELGIPELFLQNSQLAKSTRAGVHAMGLSCLVNESPSEAVTAALLPEAVWTKTIDGQKFGKKLIRMMADDYGVYVIGGQDELEGRIVRLSHFGYISIFDVVTALSALEMSYSSLVQRLKEESGVKLDLQPPPIGSAASAALQAFFSKQSQQVSNRKHLTH